MKLAELQPNIDHHMIEHLEHMLELAREGKVNDVVVVADVRTSDGPIFYRTSSFEDAWRLLGALEYAKDSVLKGMGVR